jgi:putative transposase
VIGSTTPETVNGYYKSELIYGPTRPGPWKTIDNVEHSTMEWVDWHNNRRLHSQLNYIPRDEYEAAYYAQI